MSQFFEHRLKYLNEEFSSKYEESSKLIERTSDALKTLQWALSVGVRPSETISKHAIPVRIYISEITSEDIKSILVGGIVQLLEGLSFESDLDLPGEDGSWWKRFWMQSREIATHEEIQNRLFKIERIAETRLLEKPQAEANKAHASAVATILKSLEHVNSACIQIGNILLVKFAPNKTHASVMVRTLSPVEMRALEKNQTLLKDPATIIQKLEQICSTRSTKRGSRDNTGIRL
jgi:hypothetical protein